MKDCLCKTMPEKMAGNFVLVLQQAGGAAGNRKGGGQVQVQPYFYTVFPGKGGGPSRIFHKHHGAYGRNRASASAIEDAVGSQGITPPIVSVDDEEARGGMFQRERQLSIDRMRRHLSWKLRRVRQNAVAESPEIRGIVRLLLRPAS